MSHFGVRACVTDNTIGDRGAQALAVVLPRTLKLTELDLSGMEAHGFVVGRNVR